MRIARLRMVNYRRHRDTEIEFPDGVTAIVGRNGSGKTTIIEAIGFALYGAQATRTQKGLLRSDAAAAGDEVRVEVDAEVAGQALQVVRALRGTAQTGVASLTIDGQTIVAAQAGSSEAVTTEITRRIGLDREAFFNTVCAQQKELGRLAQKSKADRKRLVLGMLGIDALDRAIVEAGARRREAEARLAALQERMPGLADAEEAHAQAHAAHDAATAATAAAYSDWQEAEGRLKTALEALEAARRQDGQRRSFEAERERALLAQQHAEAMAAEHAARVAQAEAAAQQAEDLAAAAADLEPARQALEQALEAHHARQRLEESERRVVMLRAELAALQVPPAPNGLLDASKVEVAATQGRLEEAQRQATVLATESRAVQERLRRVATLDAAAPCPVCERPLDGHAHRLRADLDAELRSTEAARRRAEAERDAARQALARAQDALQEASAQQRRHEEAMAARQRIEQVLGRALEEHVALGTPPVGDDVDSLRRRLAAAQHANTRRAEHLAVAAQLAPALAGHEQAQAARAQAARRLAEAEAAMQALPPAALPATEAAHLQAVEQERQAERRHAAAVQAQQVAQARREAAAARLREAQEARIALVEANRRHREWQVLAGVRGTGLLDRFRSHLVSRIGPAVAAEASRLLARFTGGRYTEVLLDDDYEIYVSDSGVRYHLERFSGGEADLVHLALRLAVSRLLVERSGGAEIRFLALDEVFGSLDDERRGHVLAALQELGTLYSQVLLVTHHEELREALDHTLVVLEQDGAATVRMHNG